MTAVHQHPKSVHQHTSMCAVLSGYRGLQDERQQAITAAVGRQGQGQQAGAGQPQQGPPAARAAVSPGEPALPGLQGMVWGRHEAESWATCALKAGAIWLLLELEAAGQLQGGSGALAGSAACQGLSYVEQGLDAQLPTVVGAQLRQLARQWHLQLGGLDVPAGRAADSCLTLAGSSLAGTCNMCYLCSASLALPRAAT